MKRAAPRDPSASTGAANETPAPAAVSRESAPVADTGAGAANGIPAPAAGAPGRGYFEGWYFKQVSADWRHLVALIPGVSLGRDPHSFVQAFDGNRGVTAYYRYSLEEFQPAKRGFAVDVGPNSFSAEGFSVDLRGLEVEVSGQLTFSGGLGFPVRPLAPGVMGPYAFAPAMECYHGVVSVDHRTAGTLRLGAEDVSFDGGDGYIEKDWGKSFPRTWIWLHSNSFDRERTSLLVSRATIPWMGSWFPGFLSFLWADGKLYRFATYTGAKVSRLDLRDDGFTMVIQDRRHELELDVTKKNSSALVAPVAGTMERYIKESIDSEVAFELRERGRGRAGRVVAAARSERSGLEMVGDLDELLPR